MKKLIHGGDVYRNPDCIDFSANINPLGPPNSVKKAVAACVNDIAHYPDVQCKELKKRLGWAERMEEEALIIGNGAAELIFALGYSLIFCKCQSQTEAGAPAATDICRI